MRLMAAEATTNWSALMPEEGRRTILVVDEEPQLLQVIRVILGREGYEVLSARSLREAVRIAEEHAAPIHLLLIDALAPEARNPELLGRLCAGRTELKMVLMSDAEPQGWPAPHAGFLVKPFNPDDLRQAIARAVGADDPQPAQ